MVIAQNREPWLAVLWSRIWPGLGQIYAGARLRGLAIALGFLGLAIAGVCSFLGWVGLTVQAGFVCGLLLLLLSIWSCVDAYWVTRRRNSEAFEAERQGQKDPWKAVFWTTIFLGVGHLYIRRYVFGGVFIAIGVISLAIPVALLLLPFIAVHAYWATPGVEEGSKTRKRMVGIVLVAWLLPILIGAIPAFSLRTFVAESRFIPSGAMQPTLEVDDRLLIDKLSYRIDKPQRGDIVVFMPTEELQRQEFNDAFIKRVVGLPGDTVVVKEGKVFVDGQPLDEPYILEAPDYEWRAEDLNLPAVIPAGEYFMLGDNRNNSYDSHYWGYVPREKFVGKATQRFWPVGRMGGID